MKTKSNDKFKRALRLAIIQEFDSQTNFAERAGMDETLVSKIVNRRRKPTPEQIAIFTKLLKKPADELFGIQS